MTTNLTWAGATVGVDCIALIAAAAEAADGIDTQLTAVCGARCSGSALVDIYQQAKRI
jgi:hypothetical protein